MVKGLNRILFVFAIGTISIAQAGFYDGRIPTEADLVDAGSWYCSEDEELKPPKEAAGVAAFIKKNVRAFRFEKTDKDDTFRNVGEFTNQNFTINTKVDGLAVVQKTLDVDFGEGVRTPVFNVYEILRISNGVLMWVWATEDEKGSGEYDPVNFRAIKNGRIKATLKCLSEKALKNVLIKTSGCTIRQVTEIFDTANFFKDVDKMASKKKDPKCTTCGFDSIVAMGEKWLKNVSCDSGVKGKASQPSTATKGIK